MSSAGGRLRDITALIVPSEETTGVEVAAIVTSNGKLILVDVQRLLDAHEEDLDFNTIVLGVSAIPVEPRLICVTGALLQAKASKHSDNDVPTVALPPHMLDNEATVEGESEEDEELEVVEKVEKVKKTKKRKKATEAEFEIVRASTKQQESPAPKKVKKVKKVAK